MRVVICLPRCDIVKTEAAFFFTLHHYRYINLSCWSVGNETRADDGCSFYVGWLKRWIIVCLDLLLLDRLWFLATYFIVLCELVFLSCKHQILPFSLVSTPKTEIIFYLIVPLCRWRQHLATVCHTTALNLLRVYRRKQILASVSVLGCFCILFYCERYYE